MSKTDAQPEGDGPLDHEKENPLLSDAQAQLLKRLGNVSEFGIDALHAKFKEKGLVSAADSQKP